MTQNLPQQLQGIDSLIDKVWKNKLGSSVRHEHTFFMSHIKNTDKLSDEFIWQANQADLWTIYLRYLSKKTIADLFEESDLNLIKYICQAIKIHKHKDLAHYYLKDNIQENITKRFSKFIQPNIRQINDSYKQSPLYEHQIKILLADKNVDEQQFGMYLQNRKNVDKQFLRKLKKIVLKYIHRKVRLSRQAQKELGYTLRLINLYLQIISVNQTFYNLFFSKFDLSMLYLRFLQDTNGIVKLMRFFEDSKDAKTIRKQLEVTKKCLSIKRNQE